MSYSEIRADYDALETIAQQFAASAQGIEEMLQNVRSNMENLQGQWIGRGSDAFFSEMADDVLPAIARLHNALVEASETTRRISETIRSAEEEAAGLFSNSGGPTRIGGPMEQ